MSDLYFGSVSSDSLRIPTRPFVTHSNENWFLLFLSRFSCVISVGQAWLRMSVKPVYLQTEMCRAGNRRKLFSVGQRRVIQLMRDNMAEQRRQRIILIGIGIDVKVHFMQHFVAVANVIREQKSVQNKLLSFRCCRFLFDFFPTKIRHYCYCAYSCYAKRSCDRR